MKYAPTQSIRTLCLIPLAALCLATTVQAAQGESPQEQSPPASTSQEQMPKGAGHSGDMKSSMMMNMDHMQKMKMSGDVDKDFAMMMKMHHQQGVEMAQKELQLGKSTEMKNMAKQIIAAQNKEIAEIDQWLAKQK